MTWKKSFLIAAGAISSLFSVSAQFPPIPEGVKELESKIHPGVRISYKEPGICETTEGVKSFAGEYLGTHSERNAEVDAVVKCRICTASAPCAQ